MTPEELTDIDRKVAEACGIAWGISESGIWKISPSVPFRPSTDWNDAMLAVEQAGLFDKGLMIMHYGPEYSIVEQKNVEFWGVAVEKITVEYIADSPQLAICNAILTLKGKA